MAPNRRRGKNIDEVSFLEGFLFRFGSKILLGSVVVLAFLTLAQCTIQKPEAPEWNTNLAVPLVNRTYTMEELIEKMDQDGVEMDEQGNITFSLSENLDTVVLETDMLTSPDIGFEVTQSLTPVQVVAPSVDPVTISLSAITGLATGLPNDQAYIYEKSFTVVSALPIIEDFTQITVSEGSVLAIVENNLDIVLDQVIIELYDATRLQTVAVDTFPAAIVGEATDTLSISLVGKTVSNNLRINSACHTPGGMVDSASTRYLRTQLDFGDNLEVSAAVARIMATSMDLSQEFTLGETDQLNSATLTEGQLEIVITNTTSIASNILVTVPDLILGTTPLTFDIAVGADQSVSVQRDLAGYQLSPSDITVPQAMPVEVSVDIPGSGDNHISITSSDSIAVTADLTGLSFGSISGIFAGSEATFDDLSVDLDLPEGFDSIGLPAAVLTLEITNAVDLPGSLDIQLVRDDARTLTITGNIQRGASGNPVVSTVINDEIGSFLTPLPQSLTATGAATFGDGVSEGTVQAGDWVFASISIEAPLELIVSESRIQTDIESEEIDQEDIDKITDNLNVASFVYNVITHLPIGASMTVYLSSDSATVYSDPELTIGPIELNAATVNENGVVTQESDLGYADITLTNDDVQVLRNDPIYVGTELVLHGTDGVTVRVTQNDYITLTGYIEVDYNFDGEF